MRWYMRSTGDHDTHRGTLVRGSVVAQCGARFQPQGVPLVPSVLVACTDAICPDCYSWPLGLDDRQEWVALRQVSGRSVALHAGEVVAKGLSPVALFLLDHALRRLARAGMVQVAEPDEQGLARVSLTEAGLARYQALCEQARAHS